jgi:hypothetical protein
LVVKFCAPVGDKRTLFGVMDTEASVTLARMEMPLVDFARTAPRAGSGDPEE